MDGLELQEWRTNVLALVDARVREQSWKQVVVAPNRSYLANNRLLQF